MFGDYEIRSNVSKSVYIASHKSTNEFVAVKRISADNYCDDEFKLICEELTLDLQHRNIIRIRAAFVKDLDLHIVYPYFCFGSCKEAMKNFFVTGFPELLSALILKDLLQAVEYLHSRGIIHRLDKLL
jgi:serine/threonine protein kinase